MLGGDFVQQILDHNGFVVFAMDFLDFFVVAEPYWRMLRLRSTRLNFINLIKINTGIGPEWSRNTNK